MNGVYVCYSEEKQGDFSEVVEMSNDEYLIWRHKTSIRREMRYPAKVIIKISKKDIYYVGDLLLVKEYEAFNPEIFIKDERHRPVAWSESSDDTKSVLFIANLQEVPEPEEVKDIHPPRGVAYF